MNTRVGIQQRVRRMASGRCSLLSEIGRWIFTARAKPQAKGSPADQCHVVTVFFIQETKERTASQSAPLPLKMVCGRGALILLPVALVSLGKSHGRFPGDVGQSARDGILCPKNFVLKTPQTMASLDRLVALIAKMSFPLFAHCLAASSLFFGAL